MRDADDLIAIRLYGGVTGPVALEGGAVTVERPAVDLDDYSLARPKYIHLVSEHRDIRLGWGKVVAPAEGSKAIL